MDRNTVDFLFRWGTENNMSFQNIGYHQIKVKLSRPSFTFTPKKRYKLIKMITGKVAFLESIAQELNEQKQENNVKIPKEN